MISICWELIAWHGRTHSLKAVVFPINPKMVLKFGVPSGYKTTQTEERAEVQFYFSIKKSHFYQGSVIDGG